MCLGQIIGCIVAASLPFIGILWLWSAFSAEISDPGGKPSVGAFLVVIGLGIIVAVRLREPEAVIW